MDTILDFKVLFKDESIRILTEKYADKERILIVRMIDTKNGIKEAKKLLWLERDDLESITEPYKAAWSGKS